MTAALDPIARDLFDQLTARTFYVVDTEFCTHDDDVHHLISLAIVPVIGGHRVATRQELYRVMNPGVPIDPETQTKHKFTDDDVADKPHFDQYANVIAARLADPGAVFVCHTSIDAHVLRREFQRLHNQTAGHTPSHGRAPQLPNLPVLDTQRLATVIGHPGVGVRSRISLDRLCDLVGVARPQEAHNARQDARATANALIALLRYSAEHTVYWTLEDLLDAASGGTLHDPAGPGRIRKTSSRRAAPPLPVEHLARHTQPLTEPATAGSEPVERWLEMAAECATLRCPYLRDEARVAAGNGAVLLRPLMDDLPHFTEPGQAATLLGAVHELLQADPAPGRPPVLRARSALPWWRAARTTIAASTPCAPGSARTSCPSCQEGQPCPRDVIRLAVSETVTIAGARTLDETRIRALLSRTEKSAINTWRKHHPDVLAYALWRVAARLLEDGRDETAYTAIDQALALNLCDLEPRLAVLACDRLLETADADAAFALADRTMRRRTTDPAYDDVAEWALYTRNALYAQRPDSARVITHPRLARPTGHANPRLYT